ncbi:hypothetical protein BKA58DRAFT_216526 [Alternaria rosae]|uniref:uncharacterized protein n=1 Tax=Alternaria rosae TaxID=1187941 RepID=UPI001E8D631B|nr:uncharacterized protein BKA58DRAFT_216526 [Alternaria rosae]KAH6867039.1 hypothetical protein BKA58DRAFT_216526 [Alternaria rosae]
MASFFYSTKTGSKSTYPLPDSLNADDILQILHNHSVLSQIFWPHSSATIRTQPSSTSNVSNFIVGQYGSEYKATLCSQSDGVVCTEEMPLGVKATITYVVVGRDQLAKQQIARSEIGEAGSTSSSLNLSNSSTTPLDHQLYLLEEIAATAFKPLASLISIKQNKLIPKTGNLVKVLENLGGPQKDLISALSELNDIRTHVDADISLDKAKEE